MLTIKNYQRIEGKEIGLIFGNRVGITSVVDVGHAYVMTLSLYNASALIKFKTTYLRINRNGQQTGGSPAEEYKVEWEHGMDAKLQPSWEKSGIFETIDGFIEYIKRHYENNHPHLTVITGTTTTAVTNNTIITTTITGTSFNNISN